MQQNGRYQSPLGEILLAADELGMLGLWFEGQRYFGLGLQKDSETRETPVLETARRWLDVYFSGQDPSFSVPLHVQGTEFQQRESPAHNFLWRHLHLWADCAANGGGKRRRARVCAGSRPCGGPQPRFSSHPLPSRRRHGRQSHRLCRGHPPEGKPPCAGAIRRAAALCGIARPLRRFRAYIAKGVIGRRFFS